MGRQKLLLPWRGRPVVRQIVEQLLASRVSKVVVVTGGDHDAIVASLEGLSVGVANNPHPEHGMLASLRVGLRATPREMEAFMVVLGDQPSLQTSVVDGLIAEWQKDPRCILRPRFGDANGHPLIVPAEFVSRALSQYDEVGLKGLLREFPDRVRAWEVRDEGVVRDIDTPADYQSEIERLGINP